MLGDSPHVWGLTASALGLIFECVSSFFTSTGFDNTAGVLAEKEYLDQLLPLCPPRVAASPHFPGKQGGVADPKRRQHCLVFHKPHSPHPTPFRKPHPFQLCIIH